MDERYTRYIENLRRVRALARPETHAGMKAADLLEEIKQNAAESYALMQQSNAILDEVLFSRRAENMTEEEAAGLSEFAGKLFHYANSEDCGIAYKIHALLLDYARLAVTEENVALLARQALAARPQVNAAPGDQELYHPVPGQQPDGHVPPQPCRLRSLHGSVRQGHGGHPLALLPQAGPLHPLG